jgi:uncharacterized protein YjbI with pentapeptide repeats
MPVNQPLHIKVPRLPKPLPSGKLESLTDHAEITICSLSGCDLAAQSAKDVLFEQIHIRRCIFTQTQLTLARFIDAYVEVSDFSGAYLVTPRFRRVEFSGCRLSGAQLLEAQIDDVLFLDCIFEGTVLGKVTCKAVRFEKCNIRGAFFEESDLSNVVFSHCDLTNTSLRASTLHSADLRGSILNGVQANPQDLRGAIIEPVQAIQIVGLLGVMVKEADDIEFIQEANE